MLFQLSGSLLAAWAVIPVSLVVEKLANTVFVPRRGAHKSDSSARLTVRRALSKSARARASVQTSSTADFQHWSKPRQSCIDLESQSTAGRPYFDGV